MVTAFRSAGSISERLSTNPSHGPRFTGIVGSPRSSAHRDRRLTEIVGAGCAGAPDAGPAPASSRIGEARDEPVLL